MITNSENACILLKNTDTGLDFVGDSLVYFLHLVMSGILNFKDISIWDVKHFYCLLYIFMIIFNSW